MTHFAHYIKRTIVLSTESNKDDWKSVSLPFIENQPDDQGFERPSYHSVPKSSRARIGDTFWLFSQLNTPWGSLPPSLDARIRIGKVSFIGEGKERRTKFDACYESVWLPIFDASLLLEELLSVSASRETKSLLSASAKHVGQALRFPREIANPEVLIEHSRSLEVMPQDFISYRHLDGTQSAFLMARQLALAGRAVFWDRWSLPRRMSERCQNLSKLMLDQRVRQQIERSARVFGVWSPTYGAAGTYSQLEKELAMSFNKFELFRGL